MNWFRVSGADGTVPRSPEGLTAEEEKNWRLSLLNEEERRAFDWFRLGYTARWTAETMLLGRCDARRLFGAVFRKLNAADETEVLRLYRTTVLEPQELSEKNEREEYGNGK